MTALKPEPVNLWKWAKAAAEFAARRSSDAAALAIASLVALTLGAITAGEFPPKGIVFAAHFALWVSGIAYLRWLMPAGEKLRPGRIIFGTGVAAAASGAAVLFALASMSRGVPTLGQGIEAIIAQPTIPLAIVLAVPAVIVGRRLAEMDLIREPADADLARRTESALSVVFHELRRPLTVLVTSSEVALDPEVPDNERRELLESIHRNALRLNDYLEELLESARIQAKSRSMLTELVDLANLARHVVHELSDSTLTHKITVSSDSPAYVAGDPARLKMVVRNLISNAIRYTPGDSAIQVSTNASAGRVALVVEDNGPGIPEAYCEKIFDQFYRIPGSRSGGFGLGLYVTRQLVIAHGGTIAVQHAEPHGARFVVSLPAAREVPVSSDRPVFAQSGPKSEPLNRLELAHIAVVSREHKPARTAEPSTPRRARAQRSSRPQRGHSS